MSDEERKAIERLIFYKDKIKDELYPIINFEEEKAIGVVLNLIEKQFKEIEELKIAFNNCFDECTSLRENFHKQIEISKNKDQKWGDKIKAKIEEVDKDENASIPDFIEYAKEYATQKLQSLLEKE